jgi:predicted GIY-YIG superfamily endonuclease
MSRAAAENDTGPVFRLLIKMKKNKKKRMWLLYVIQNKQYTYVGVTNNPQRRLRAHNGEIKGGAKYTTSKGSGWAYKLVITGFRTYRQVLQFEWAVKHARKTGSNGFIRRLRQIHQVMSRKRWTKKSPLARKITLQLWLPKNERS